MLALRVGYVRVHTGETAIFPSAVTPRLEFRGRRYDRSETEARLDPGYVRLGTDMGGGGIYGPPRYRLPTGVEVVSGHRVVTYVLEGGP